MPLEQGKENIGRNIEEMEQSGHPRKQAVAAALHTAYDVNVAECDISGMIPIQDAQLNWSGGDLDWTSGGVGATSSHSQSTGAVSGVDSITKFDGSE